MKVNKNLLFLREQYLKKKRGVVLEGGSRSGKTWSSIDFIIWLCSAVVQNKTFLIIRETYNSFKTTLYEDFNRRLPMFGIPSPFANRQEVHKFDLFTNKIIFLGADNDRIFQGVGSDFVYFNEALEIKKEVFNQVEQRCRKFWWMDYNPKYLNHWIYDNIHKRSDVATLRTTFIDNPYISEGELKKILSYEPIEENIQAGTADPYMWAVMGRGERAAPEGLIFPYVTWIDKFPECPPEQLMFGLDFGYTNSPSCLVKLFLDGEKLYIQNLFYAPTPSVQQLAPVIAQHAGKAPVWADPSGDYGNRAFISELRRAGFKVYAANTAPGTIQFSIGILKNFKLNIVRDKDAMAEQNAYRYKVVKGIAIDEPEDDFNHFWDAVRMAVLGNLSRFRKNFKQEFNF
jgi:PBSX family phage terminase large subunit